MLTPIGSFMSRMDAALTGSIDSIIAAMVAYAATPVALCAALYYIMQGVKFAAGDADVLPGFFPRLAKVGTIVWLSSNLDAFNLWVRDFVFQGIPNGLILALPGGVPTTVSGTAAAFDAVWNQIWVIVGTVWMQIGFSVTGVLAGVTGVLTVLFGCGGLLVIAMVYLGARMVFAIIVCLAPVIIGCAIFEATKGVAERAIGKAVALIILQVAGFVIMQIILLGNQWFMVQATNAILTAANNRAVLAEGLQILLAVCAWFICGAYGMWQLRAVAYSIGAGVSMPGPSAYALAAIARAAGKGSGGGPSAPPSPPPAPPPNYALSINRDALATPPASGPVLALPPPAPPSIATSTRS